MRVPADALAGEGVELPALRVDRLGDGHDVADLPSIDGRGDEPVDAAGVVGREELERQPADPPAGRRVREALGGAGQGAHGAALVPPDVAHGLLHLCRAGIVVETGDLGVPMEEEPSLVARREYVPDAEVEDGVLAGEAGPALGEHPGGENRAGVEAAQDVEEEVVG